MIGETLQLQSSSASSSVVRRVGVFGFFGSGNLGNDGSLEAFLSFLREVPFPVEITCICYAEKEVRQRFKIRTFPIAPAPSTQMAFLNKLLLKFPNRLHNLIRITQAAQSFDVIFVPGTGILDDFGERWQGMPYHLALWGAAARIAGTPFAFVSIGAGPIEHPMSRRLMIIAARLARYRSFRDNASRSYVARFGVDTKHDSITPDIAFALAAPSKTRVPADRPTIGLGVMTYFGWRRLQANGTEIYERYISKLSEFASWLLEKGFRLRLLMGGAGDPIAIDDLRERISTPAFADRIIAEPVASLSELMTQMSETELLVASRFHNIVCALKVGLPAISIGYAEKNDRLLNAAGLGRFTQSIETLDITRLKQQFDELYENREQYRMGVEALRECYSRELREQNRRLQETFLSQRD